VLRETFGMTFRVYDTSGGNYCLRAQTETGHWIHITDAWESLSTMYERDHAWVKDGECRGYGTSVFGDDECGQLAYANTDPLAISYSDVVALVADALDHIATCEKCRP
jgi:hypothetical protein